MRGVDDAVHDGVAHVHVRRGHIDFGAQHAGAVRELAGLHAREQIHILFNGAVAERALFAGLGEGAAILANLVGVEVVDVGLAVLDELHRPVEELIEVIGGVAELVPGEAEPAHIGLNGVDVLGLFF